MIRDLKITSSIQNETEKKYNLHTFCHDHEKTAHFAEKNIIQYGGFVITRVITKLTIMILNYKNQIKINIRYPK